MPRDFTAIVILVSLSGCAHEAEPPTVVLWAWERPEDLTFLKPGDAEIALLVNRIELFTERVIEHPRSQPLAANPGISVLPVIRIEAVEPSLDAAQLDLLLEAISRSTLDSRFRGLQIDFDARESQRAFYRSLLEELRPHFAPLSMTALISWCSKPSWLAGLPVDEIVPMAFRMGPGGGAWIQRMEREKGFTFGGCNSSLGVSTDEPLRWQPSSRRLYLFHPSPWSEAAYDDGVSSLD